MRRKVDGIVFLLALGLFATTHSREVWPGSASLLVRQGGIDPFPSLGYPVFSLLVRAMARVLPCSLVGVLTALTVLLAAASVMLIGTFARGLLPGGGFDARGERAARTVAGTVASASLALSFPFWLAATRPSVEPWLIFLLLAGAASWQNWLARGRGAWGWIFALCWGAGIAEHPLFIALGPVFLVSLARRLWQMGCFADAQRLKGALRRQVSLAHVWGPVLLLLVVSLSAIGIHAAWYAGHEVMQWREIDGIWPVAQNMAGVWLSHARQGFPPVGWLLIVGAMLVPCVYLMTASLSDFYAPDLFASRVFLYLAFAAALFFALWMERLAPGLAFPIWPHRVLPSVAAAVASGLLAGWWWRVGSANSPIVQWAPRFPAVRRIVQAAVVIVPATGLGLAGLHHAGLIARTNRQPLAMAISDAMDRVTAGDTLVVDAVSHDLALLLAHQRRLPLRIVAWHRIGQTPYRRQLAAIFSGERDSDLILTDPVAFVRAYSSVRRRGPARVAGIGMPGEWAPPMMPLRVAGPIVRPASDEPDDADREADQAESNIRFARRIEQHAAVDGIPGLTRHWHQWAAIVASRAANDAGLKYEWSGQTDFALDAYETALRLFPENLYARMNHIRLSDLLDRPVAEMERERVTRERQGWRERGVGPEPLRHVFGDLAAARDFAGIEMDEERSFAERLVAAGRYGDHARSLYLFLMAGAADRDRMDADELARLAGDGALDAGLWRTLFLVAVQRGEWDEAQTCLARAEQAGLPGGEIAVDRAYLAWLRGDPDEAGRVLDAEVARRRRNVEAWFLLALVSESVGDEGRRKDAIDALIALHAELSPRRRAGLSLLLLDDARIADAAAMARRLLRQSSLGPYELESALRVATASGDSAMALDATRRLLQGDPGHGLANMVLGSIRLSQGDLDGAESALRRSLARERLPPVLNDLAYILAEGEGERLVEAERLSAEAVERATGFHQAWLTRARILRALGRKDEADAALRHAREVEER